MKLLDVLSQNALPFSIPLRTEFPPRHLFASSDPSTSDLEALEPGMASLRKLENLYHKGQGAAWDGRQVLQMLVERHGGVQVDPERKEAISNLMTIILWGELAAWEVASHLSGTIRDHTEAKMAATIQTFDEARHYYVLRDYLKLLDVGELPPPNAFVKSILAQLIATQSPLHKLLGMQLFVEHVALHLFRALSELQVEPVLSDLLAYFQKDEARHVGLGKLYLPTLLSKLSRKEAVEALAYQVWITVFIQMAIEYHQPDAQVLGLDIRKTLQRALKDQTEMMDELNSHHRVKGLLVLPRRLRFLNKWAISVLWPEARDGAQTTDRVSAARARLRLARTLEKAWRLVA